MLATRLAPLDALKIYALKTPAFEAALHSACVWPDRREYEKMVSEFSRHLGITFRFSTISRIGKATVTTSWLRARTCCRATNALACTGIGRL